MFYKLVEHPIRLQDLKQNISNIKLFISANITLQFVSLELSKELNLGHVCVDLRCHITIP